MKRDHHRVCGERDQRSVEAVGSLQSGFERLDRARLARPQRRSGSRPNSPDTSSLRATVQPPLLELGERLVEHVQTFR